MKPQEMTLTPYLTVDGAAEAIKFYTDVFGAKETLCLKDPNDGRIGHAELAIGGSKIMISDEYPDFGANGPVALGGTPVKMALQVADVDVIYGRALAKGALSLRGLRDEFHGHRTGQIVDPFGHIWFIQSKIDDLSADEMQSRWNATTAS